MSLSSLLMTLFSGSGWLAFGLMALRVSQIKTARDKAKALIDQQREELSSALADFEEYRRRLNKQLKDLENEIANMETELNRCNTPGSRRNALNRLLQKASDASLSAERDLPEHPSPKSP